MSLRIIAATRPTLSSTGTPIPGISDNNGDSWATRLAKLIPGEALTLYTMGNAIIAENTTNRVIAQWILVLGCLALIATLRWFATQKDPTSGEYKSPQVKAILITAISFILYLLAQPAGTGPWNLGANTYIAALVGLIWATILPIIYKGEGDGDVGLPESVAL